LKSRSDIIDSKKLSDFILVQPFDLGQTFNIEYHYYLSPIVETYVKNFQSTEEIVDYLKTTLVQEDLHKIIFHGWIVDRICFDSLKQKIDTVAQGLYERINELIDANIDNYDINSLELYIMLILISRTNHPHAKETYFKLKNKNEDRKKLCKDLIEKRYDVSFLIKLESSDLKQSLD